MKEINSLNKNKRHVYFQLVLQLLTNQYINELTN